MKITAIYCLLIGFICLGCSAYKIAPGPKNFPVTVKGTYCKVEHTGKIVARGEIIVVDTASIYILPDSVRSVKQENVPFGESKLIAISKSELDSVYIYIASTTNNAAPIIGWAMLLPVMSFFHGWYMTFTLPVNIIVMSGILSSVTGNYYGFHYPKDIAWEDLDKFARFPQGWPESVAPGDIR